MTSTSPQEDGFNVASSQTSIEDGAFNLNNAFSESSSVSYEQIFSPLEIKKNYDSQTPGFRSVFASEGSDGLFDNGHVGPTIKELNPYFPTIFGDDGEDFMENNDYIMMANETGDGTTDDINIRKLEDRKAIDTVRVVGLRGPLILSGWGFDIADRPVPEEGDGFEFKPELTNHRSYWKTGPVHLMWDEERQVWAGGLQMVCGRLLSESIQAPFNTDAPTYFEVTVLRPGNKDMEETITCTNRDPSLAQGNIYDQITIAAGATQGASLVWIVAVRINYEWIPLWVGCPEEEETEGQSAPGSDTSFGGGSVSTYPDPDD